LALLIRDCYASLRIDVSGYLRYTRSNTYENCIKKDIMC